MSKVTDQVLGHADEADGIEEYDNPLPDWWLGILWFTIIWTPIYIGWYHFTGNRSQEARLAAEVAAAQLKWPQKELDAGAIDLGAASVAEGKEIYAQNCVGCHGAALEGGIGPSLKDSVWIHGGSKEAILATITNGVTEKGMPNWGQMIGPEKVAKVTAYVITENGAVTE